MGRNVKDLETNLREIEPAINKFSSRAIPGMDTEDIMQELRIEAWTAWQSYDPDNGTKFLTYVYPILRQKTIDLYRGATAGKRSLQNENSLNALMEDDGYEPTYTMTNDFEKVELDDVVDNFYADLSEKDKAIFNLLREGYKKSEIAALCGVSPATVSRHKRKMRLNFHLALAE